MKTMPVQKKELVNKIGRNLGTTREFSDIERKEKGYNQRKLLAAAFVDVYRSAMSVKKIGMEGENPYLLKIEGINTLSIPIEAIRYGAGIRMILWSP